MVGVDNDMRIYKIRVQRASLIILFFLHLYGVLRLKCVFLLYLYSSTADHIIKNQSYYRNNYASYH